MAFRVARMARVKSGAFKARKAIPADVRDDYAALHGKRWEELFHAPPDCPPQRAKVLRAEWEAEIEARVATLRAKKRGEGHDLTPRQAYPVNFLRRGACGDYSPDQHLQTLPSYIAHTTPSSPNGHKGSKSTGTCLELFRQYVAARKIAPSSVPGWKGVLVALDAHLKSNGWDIADLGPEEAQRWARSLLTEKRGAYTVNNKYVGASRTVFGWALREKLVTSNPFAAVSIDVPRKARTREDGKGFSETEQQTILKAALAIKDTRSPVKAACRWVPWLCAYSGARGGEITQLRSQDIEQRDGFVVMKLTPDAGTVKGLIARTVPIHEHVIEQGFLDYVKAKGRGPLFYDPPTNARDINESSDPLKPKRPRAVNTLNRVAGWVRKLGITDPGVRPNHGWRHTFKARARRADIEKRVRDAICGHEPGEVADEYDNVTPADMAKALAQFPRYRSATPDAGGTDAPENKAA
jgi:integrase